LLFTEGEVENLDNSARKRKCEGFACIDHGVHGSVITGVAHDVHDGITHGVNKMMQMVFRMVLLLLFIVLLTVFMMNLIYRVGSPVDKRN